MRVRRQHSPLSLLCITMILRVRRKILKLLRSPTVVSEPRFLWFDVICTSRTQVSLDDTSHTAYQHGILWFSGIVGRDDPDQPYAYAYARPVPSTCFAHRWLAEDCLSNFS